MKPNSWIVLVALAWLLPDAGPIVHAQSLEQRLTAEDPAELAQAARQFGDPVRGAVIFYQPYLSCRTCHLTEKTANPLGPDLTKPTEKTTDAHLVESVLLPSKVLKKEFEPVTVVTTAGKTIVGLLVQDGQHELTLRDPSRNGMIVTIPKDEIEEQLPGQLSIMPAGQVNLLTSRQQFLDLIRYLIEIRDGGAARMRELEPPQSLFAARPLPEYEEHIDHAGMLSDLDQDAFDRGEAIYNQLCINCHGTHDLPGSLPTSLRFASGEFKNGNDPHTMYQTLTRGFGMMAPQTWMVPQQKYDVIHYVREAYLKSHNPTQLFPVEPAYLAGLPQGNTRGPEPSNIVPWKQMNYGPNLVMTLEVGDDGRNFAYKGNAIRLDAGPGGVSQGRYWMLFDYDTLRVSAAWSGEGFSDWNGINFNGLHNIHPRVVGSVHLANPTGPGWGRPADGSFDDVRLVGRDDRIYGPLPRDWAHYKGMYYYGQQTIIEYTVGETRLLEMPGVVTSTPQPVFTRTLNIGPRDRDLLLQVAHRDQPGMQLVMQGDVALFGPRSAVEQPKVETGADASKSNGGTSQTPTGWTVAGAAGNTQGLKWSSDGGDLHLRIPAGGDPLRLTLWFASIEKSSELAPLVDAFALESPDRDLAAFTGGGPARWPQELESEAILGNDDGPFAVDVLKRPTDNPWFCRMRLTGFDFTPDGNEAIVCAWEGSIWRVSGLNQLPGSTPAGIDGPSIKIKWRRIASGLFQPLGVKIVQGEIYVTCRDQICILHDLNGDGEIDYFENFNNDHQVTEHFHEFAMGLQTDAEGNFYYAKSARHALPALVPHHGTLLRVSRDGSRTDIVANGFRAANGVCINPDGTFIVTDQEGHWNPKNRINWVREGGFYGNMFGYHDVTDSSDDAMQQPLCWITNEFDRSPAELLWVDSPRWGPLDGTLLNLSYGYGEVYVVPHEEIDGQKQGGMCALPIPRFPTGVMRGRFHPTDGQLYLCGMFAWAGNQTQPGGMYRLRYTGQPAHLPIGLNAKTNGMSVTFTDELDAASAGDPKNYAVKVWSLKRTANYGSEHYHERSLEVTSAKLSEDGKQVFLQIPDIAPTWGMEIRYEVQSAEGKPIRGRIHNTIHKLNR